MSKAEQRALRRVKWMKNVTGYQPVTVTGLRYPTNGKREVARRARQIANGQLQVLA